MLFPSIVKLSEMIAGEEADAFVLLAAKTAGTTKDGKPFYRVTFRDAGREVSFPIWNDSIFAEACRDQWQVGQFYKVRAVYTETKFGPQLDIRKIRPVTPEDRADGFDEAMFLPRSKFDSAEMFAALVNLARTEIRDEQLAALAVDLLETHRETLLTLPAARRNHHPFVGGYLEHVLSVSRNAIFLADKYGRDYPELNPPLSRDLVVAGAILHDIGKVRELALTPAGAEYTAEGELVGHILLGRDLVRAAATRRAIAPETLLRLEHIIISHQRLPEWGSPKPPMTPEALLVHFADDVDAKFQTALAALAETSEGQFTSPRNPLQYRIFRGLLG
ncbi:MAG: HD domain-containing protein [Pirellulaceae bacterium]|nr:HD domain-containing protein [Pirellulaceae bacterium]